MHAPFKNLFIIKQKSYSYNYSMVCVENKKMIFRKIKIKENKIYISKINKRLAKKVAKKLKKRDIKRIVCSKEIMKNNEFINCMYAQNIYVHNGRYLYKNIIKNILDYLKEKKLELEKMNAAILINDNSTLNIQMIYLVSNIYKSITIVTNNSKQFYKIEKELEENGISINISNNKRKALKKVDFIFNIDYPEELINKFKINNDAIIMNIEENIKIQSKQFEGININYYEIDFENNYNEYEKFDKNLIYESFYFENRSILFTSRIKNKKFNW